MPQASSQGGKPRALEKILRRWSRPRVPNKVLSQSGRTYHLGNCIGTGSYSRCYAAVTLESRKIYAVKSMEKSRIRADDGARKRLRREIGIHRSLDHPNIVKFLDSAEDSLNVYLVLDFCSYQSLMTLVERCGGLAESDARRFFAPILQAVIFLHTQNIHHGDLKLTNVLLDGNMCPKLCDFGFAMMLDSPRCLRTKPCGTPAYMAPEILRVPSRFGLKADVWSLGVMLYSMLYGFTPFHSSTIAGVYRRIRAHDLAFPFRRDIMFSDDAIDLMYNMLNASPTARWSADTVATHLWLISPEENVPARKPISPAASPPIFNIEEVVA